MKCKHCAQVITRKDKEFPFWYDDGVILQGLCTLSENTFHEPEEESKVEETEVENGDA